MSAARKIIKIDDLTPEELAVLRLPFGLKNAPADFSRVMHQNFGDLQYVQIYLDDITIHSKTFNEHLEHIDVVFSRLAEMNIRINLKKCTWCRKEVKVLGFLISENGVRIDPGKVTAIQNMSPPKTVKQVQQLMGIFNYYREFIKDFAKMAKRTNTQIKRKGGS